MLSDIAEIISGGQYREATLVAYDDTINVGIIVNARYLSPQQISRPIYYSLT